MQYTFTLLFVLVSASANASLTISKPIPANAGNLEEEKRAGEEYLQRMKKESGAIVIEEGIVLLPMRGGSGGKPAHNSVIVAHYEGTDRDGKVFDSSYEREMPATFPLDATIRCWGLAVQRMAVGSLFKITCPASTAYGDKGQGPLIKPGAALTFRIELLEIQ